MIVQLIERVLASGVLNPAFTRVAAAGATPADLESEAVRLGRRLSAAHVELLSRWNGLNLDVIRLYGTATSDFFRLERAGTLGIEAPSDAIVIGSDPAGFVYLELGHGEIVTLDTDGGGLQREAASLYEYLADVVFGRRAAEFAGDDWYERLCSAGLGR